MCRENWSCSNTTRCRKEKTANMKMRKCQKHSSDPNVPDGSPNSCTLRQQKSTHTDRHRIVLRPRSSKFVEIFRTTPVNTVCPNFYVLSHANGCGFVPLCTYCYLKSSFWHLNGQHVFNNRDKMLKEIRGWIRLDNLESYVLNAGNLSDSLSFEIYRPLIADLVEVFRQEAKDRPHTLLLVTKGGLKEVSVLLRLKPCDNIAISFSVNNPVAAATHEAGAATVEDRLEAARRLKKKGWRIRMRIDPIILGFDYGWITRQVKALKPERVTLGTLRAEHNLGRFVKTPILRALEKCSDLKSLARYPLKTRLKMYRDGIRILGTTCPVGLCEETYDIWRDVGLDIESNPCNCGG